MVTNDEQPEESDLCASGDLRTYAVRRARPRPRISFLHYQYHGSRCKAVARVWAPRDGRQNLRLGSAQSDEIEVSVTTGLRCRGDQAQVRRLVPHCGFGTSSAGFRSKNPTGINWKPAWCTGMMGQ